MKWQIMQKNTFLLFFLLFFCESGPPTESLKKMLSKETQQSSLNLPSSFCCYDRNSIDFLKMFDRDSIESLEKLLTLIEDEDVIPTLKDEEFKKKLQGEEFYEAMIDLSKLHLFFFLFSFFPLSSLSFLCDIF